MKTVRFAPSPTGYIHIGNARTALFNWLYAKRDGGRFILRLDDTDQERSEERYAQAIVGDLNWLGIEPDETVRQSDRFATYAAAAERLKAEGLLYPCYETQEELERRRRLRLARRLPPIYGREALKLSEEERADLEASGKKPHWRFRLPNFRDDPFQPEPTPVEWDDLVRGPQQVDLASLSDPVLIRADGTWLYTLPSVVDDGDLGVTDIIRGDDHVTNTGVQLALFDALELKRPNFGHHNLLTDPTGAGLSKRTGAQSIRGLREAGLEPMAVASMATLIGTSQSVKVFDDLDALAEDFDPASASKSAARYDETELWALNRSILHETPFADVEERLGALGIDGEEAPGFWMIVRANLDRFEDVQDWWHIVKDGPVEPVSFESDDDRNFARAAFDHLPEGEWDETIWKRWTDAVKAETGRKGRGLFMPLRLALTGRRAGPELADLVVLLGRERTLARRP
ncbi:glutamate--tRNA ligase [Notoacmeibacter ruber]|uniref:Glutamate--tRNA ligase n=1 Tax=Notoacmeibacter ruber TaxID=2670375 RepID=A0A3L7JDM9_9HYPH|nr:glutamate--tRNA ligase [Notoacmeibacter ruber]RLQ87691.1 glutamate--tRNA ligase [Notoacmeibacter ruber]